jgi:AcrR family transcriptional regulator
MPRLWDDTIESHRLAVRDATLDAAGTLVAEGGPTTVTMSRVAERTGIGRATLYKYFADVDEILVAWHERQINAHLRHLIEIRDRTQGTAGQLEAVLAAYAELSSQHGGSAIAAALHQGDHVVRAEHELHEFFKGLLADRAAAGDVRTDVSADELASYCRGALTAAAGLRSMAAVKRLVAVTVDGLRPSR